MPRSTPDPDRYETRFAELAPPFSKDEARAQAGRCLFCFDAPCTRACPTTIDVPRFIRQILHDNPAGAAATILDANILGGSCARVCPTEVLCEGACVDRILQGAAVPIGRLQRYAVDWADRHELVPLEPGADTGRRVAVIGAGPAGLACAAELRRHGHGVTIFEAADIPGGLNSVGIAAYKISSEYALAEVERVRTLGAEIRLATPVDAALLAELRREYDAVFLGVGLGKTAALGIPGEDCDGVWEALDFIAQTHRLPPDACVVGRRVVVIGGGNTAIDAATAAVRLGAEQVTIAYRRTEAEMPAYRHEYELAKADGVAFSWLVAASRVLHEDGKVCGLSLQRLQLQGSGRKAGLVPIPDSEHVLGCDMVIKALGQQPRGSLLDAVEGLETSRGRIVVDPASGATSLPGLFAGGDCISLGAEVVNAVAEGKAAARGIAAYLGQGKE